MGLFNFLGGSKPKAPNTIANLKTVPLQSPTGPVTAILMGLNIPDPETADAFVKEVAEKFKAQRMCSPPDTSVMLVTIIGEMPAGRFVERWRQLAADDNALGFFMSRMQKADVLRGTTVGQDLGDRFTSSPHRRLKSYTAAHTDMNQAQCPVPNSAGFPISVNLCLPVRLALIG